MFYAVQSATVGHFLKTSSATIAKALLNIHTLYTTSYPFISFGSQTLTKTERRLPYSIDSPQLSKYHPWTAWRPRSYPEIVTSQYLWDEQGPEPTHLNATFSGSCRSSQTLLSQHAILSKWMLNTMGGIELLAKEAFESKMLASLNKMKRECSLRRRDLR